MYILDCGLDKRMIGTHDQDTHGQDGIELHSIARVICPTGVYVWTIIG
jgi:hypothetical protein